MGVVIGVMSGPEPSGSTATVRRASGLQPARRSWRRGRWAADAPIRRGHFAVVDRGARWQPRRARAPVCTSPDRASDPHQCSAGRRNRSSGTGWSLAVGVGAKRVRFSAEQAGRDAGDDRRRTVAQFLVILVVDPTPSPAATRPGPVRSKSSSRGHRKPAPRMMRSGRQAGRYLRRNPAGILVEANPRRWRG